MSGHDKPFSIWAACMVASLGVAFVAAGASQASTSKVQCEISASTSDNTTMIKGLAHATETATGSYNFTVSGEGTNIRQGGAFSATPNETLTLNTINLGGNAKGYTVQLDITTNGKTTQCAEWIGRI